MYAYSVVGLNELMYFEHLLSCWIGFLTIPALIWSLVIHFDCIGLSSCKYLKF